MNVTKPKVLEIVEEEQPTTPKGVANRLCKTEGKPSDISEEYQTVLDQVKTYMIQLEDQNELKVDLNWKYSICNEEQSLTDRIANLI